MLCMHGVHLALPASDQGSEYRKFSLGQVYEVDTGITMLTLSMDVMDIWTV